MVSSTPIDAIPSPAFGNPLYLEDQGLKQLEQNPHCLILDDLSHLPKDPKSKEAGNEPTATLHRVTLHQDHSMTGLKF